jgi:uncharacterized protein (TIGR02118 family)
MFILWNRAASSVPYVPSGSGYFFKEQLMLKVVSMMKRKDGLTIQEFRQWALQEHAEIGKRMPGIRHYRISVVTDDHAGGPYDLVSELYFDDEAAFKAALESDVGAEAGADIKAHCAEDRFRLMTEETIVVE